MWGINRKGQSLLEYAILAAGVIVVILVGQILVTRGLRGRWFDASKQLGDSFTTNQFYTEETQQLSARQEDTGTSTQVSDKDWVKSETITDTTVANPLFGSVGALGTYAGVESTKTDYVTQDVGAQAVGTHDVFDSGEISTIGLFEDD